MTRLAVLASHEGTTLQAILDACANSDLDAEVVLVISNNSRCGALARANSAGVATLHLSSKTHPTDTARDDAMLEALREAAVDWILLLGYMKKLGDKTQRAYSGHVLNTHPALLPKYGGKGFFGRNVHEAVLASGDVETGATVHLVDAAYDTGPLLSQIRIPVNPNDTVQALEARVKIAEQKLLINTMAELISRRQVSNY